MYVNRYLKGKQSTNTKINGWRRTWIHIHYSQLFCKTLTLGVLPFLSWDAGFSWISQHFLISMNTHLPLNCPTNVGSSDQILTGKLSIAKPAWILCNTDGHKSIFNEIGARWFRIFIKTMWFPFCFPVHQHKKPQQNFYHFANITYLVNIVLNKMKGQQICHAVIS